MSSRILILANNDTGLYRFRREVVAALVDQGWDVHISVPDTGFVSRIEALGVTIHPADVDRRGTNPLRDMKLYRYYVRLLHDVSPDVVLTYTIKPIVYGGIACRRAHIPVIANVTGLSSAMHDSPVFGRFLVAMYRAGLRGASYVFFQNTQNRDFIISRGCIPRGAEVITVPGSGVNLDEHKAVPYPGTPDDGEIRLLYVGRIVDIKGSWELVHALRAVHDKYPRVVTDVVGDYEADSADKYRPYIDELAQDGIIRFHGFRSDVDRYYAACHGFINPTYSEGMSNVLLEAAACGRPLMASDIPGCREVFEDGVGGILFKVADTDALVGAIDRFMAMSPDEREAMGRAARSYVEEHFDRRLVADEYIKAVRQILEAGK